MANETILQVMEAIAPLRKQRTNVLNKILRLIFVMLLNFHHYAFSSSPNLKMLEPSLACVTYVAFVLSFLLHCVKRL